MPSCGADRPPPRRAPAAAWRPSTGVAGARANQPPALSTAQPTAPPPGATQQAAAGGAATATTPVPAPSGPVPGRSSETTNYEISKLVRHTVMSAGAARAPVGGRHPRRRTRDDPRAGRHAQTTATRAWNDAGKQRIRRASSPPLSGSTPNGATSSRSRTSRSTPFRSRPSRQRPAIMHAGHRRGQAALAGGSAGFGIFFVAMFALFGVLRPLARRAGTLVTRPQLPAMPRAGRAAADGS